MFDIVLVHPEIPPNTGNVIRLAANTGARLHLVEPLGFTLEDKQLKRAGLDYHDLASMQVHRNWDTCRSALAGRRMFALTTKATTSYAEMRYRDEDVFVFGREADGLPEAILGEFSPATRLMLPMRPGNRSLNLSNSVAVVIYEAWRQGGFK
ncbi:MAG: tRNA (cytidine/uridine-2-O-)-methyltransferase [Betaproteobacteria bacterium]|jgi:tRNA (cytidine/uridine-2'-O-)-methyltransferase|nr:tRNA (cytidine/uridine-2-O-)-methyltransferase [Betaproteobacteria bacterium]